MSDGIQRRAVLKAGGVALLGGLAGCGAPSGSPDGKTPEGPSESGLTLDENGEAGPYTRVYRETIASVVLVRTGGGTGTGFLVDDTHIVTNAHVVGTADEASVRFREGQWRSGTVVGRDRYSDLAVVAVENTTAAADPLPLIEGEARVGQQVVAIGNPFSLEGTVTAGIISGVDRSIPSPGGIDIPDAVQTDAAVNPGNSGGPLVTLDGNVAAVINSGGGENIAFGISVPLVRRVVPSLIETGSYEHAYVGATFANVTPRIASANGVSPPRGVLALRLRRDSPARGVLRPSDDTAVVDGVSVPVGGDVVVAVEGNDVRSPEDFRSYLALETSPGDAVSFDVLRDGERTTIEFELGERPPPAAFPTGFV